MSDRYPMLPPAAESVDSIIRLCPADDRPADRPLSESRKPAESSSAKVVRFPGSRVPERVQPDRRAPRPACLGINMHDALFRSYDLIVESDEADLVQDVSRDLDKAQTKLRRLKEALQSYQERATAHIQLLTTADTKLSAAIVAALLSTRGQTEG